MSAGSPFSSCSIVKRAFTPFRSVATFPISCGADPSAATIASDALRPNVSGSPSAPISVRSLFRCGINCSWMNATYTCRVLYRTDQLTFVQFRTEDWPGYRDFSNYVRVALFPEHLRPADPQSPGVTNFVQAIAREVAAQQQHLLNRRHPAHGQGNGQGASDRDRHLSKPNQANGQGASAPKTCAKVPQGNGMKPPPKSAPARGRRTRANAEDGHSLKPVRSIAGLTIADFLYDR